MVLATSVVKFCQISAIMEMVLLTVAAGRPPTAGQLVAMKEIREEIRIAHSADACSTLALWATCRQSLIAPIVAGRAAPLQPAQPRLALQLMQETIASGDSLILAVLASISAPAM